MCVTNAVELNRMKYERKRDKNGLSGVGNSMSFSIQLTDRNVPLFPGLHITAT